MGSFYDIIGKHRSCIDRYINAGYELVIGPFVLLIFIRSLIRLEYGNAIYLYYEFILRSIYTTK